MKEKLITVLKDKYSLYLDDCLSFIYALQRGLYPLHILPLVIEACLMAGLITKEKDKYVLVNPKTQVTDTWNWVTDEYLQHFIDVGVERSKWFKSQLKSRMRKLIVHHAKNGEFLIPSEILEATHLYCQIKANNALFGIREPRYFIFKDKVENSDLYEFILQIRELKEKHQETDELSNLKMN